MKTILSRISPALSVWLLIVWLLVFNSVSPLTIVSGILVSLGVQILFPMPRVGTRWPVRVISVMILLARFLWDALMSGLHVAWIVLAGKEPTTGIVRVDLHSNDPVHVTILSAMTSLIPGTIVVHIDRTSGRMYLHVLDLDGAGGPEGVRDQTERQEARILRALAPRTVTESMRDRENAR
ncbi:Na+/H+ antiporter subunit E [Schaalia sp. ZJ405]|uniref:Na+/H+ antiporter subunit E n=1 Tax=Schaalia sp. ZJ405 TaxID=2709403 RepID=UPI0013ECC30D|nr:Na+/H+ antiporter subunit E [Schaalia sp. ZJ405]QPK81177.1 Na+/H+ antiporter subunit E [Schaalia sp. ZJ405]